jgi:transmembrane protein EpsG
MYYSLFNGLRQDLSVGIFIYSTKYILEKNKIKYILLIIFAILVHKSAIILLPLYWVVNIRFNNFMVILILIISVILIYIDITSYIKLALTNFNLPYVAYISGNKFSSSPNMYIKFVTIISILGAIGLFILNRNNPKENIVFNLFLFGMILKALTLHMLILGRLSYYIKPFIILYIVYIIFNVIKNQKSRKISLILFSLVFYIFSLIQLNSISKVLDAYTQYSLNFNLVGKANPIQVFGNYKNVTRGQ